MKKAVFRTGRSLPSSLAFFMLLAAAAYTAYAARAGGMPAFAQGYATADSIIGLLVRLLGG